MDSYHYLHGKRVTVSTPELETLAFKMRIPLPDLMHIKKIKNYTDFGVKQAAQKATRMGLSLQSLVMIESDLK